MATTLARTLPALLLLAALPAQAGAPAGRYVAQGDVVVDRETKLQWQKAPAPEALSHADAAKYCGALKLNGRGGWRLPTMRELSTLVDVRAHDPAIDTAAFPHTPAEGFWTGTPFVGTANFLWKLDFATGLANGASASLPQRVRCVQ